MTIKITTHANLSVRLFTTVSNDKKLFEALSLTTFEAGPGFNGRFNCVQAVVAVCPFVDDTVSVL